MESKPPLSLATLNTLHRWADKGWLRRLDSALASFMQERDSNATPALLVSTAILAQMEGRGHTCLPLAHLIAHPEEVLAWPPQAQVELQTLWSRLPVSLREWLDALRASPLVRLDSGSADLGQPLVLKLAGDESLLYLRRYWLHEQQVAHQIRQRCSSSQTVDESLAAKWLDRLFEDSKSPNASAGTINWQKFACAMALRASLTVITGGPGTGKTYTAARLLSLLFAMSAEPERLRVALAAPTGKAAARLRQSIDFSLQELSSRLGAELDLTALTRRMGAAKTLHALLGARLETREFAFNASNPLDVDILIVDEASMIHLEMMSALLQALPAGAKLILLGDKDQLASVEAGAVLGDLCRDAVQGNYSSETARYAQSISGQNLPAEFLKTTGNPSALAQQTVMLRQSHRFGGLIGQLALAVNSGQSALSQSVLEADTTGVLHYSKQPSVDHVAQLAARGRDGAQASYADYLRIVKAGIDTKPATPTDHEAWVKSVLKAFDRFRILCAVHEGDWGTRALNHAVQRALSQADLLNARGEWFTGRPVMVTRNDPALGVFNGDVGVTLPGPPGTTALRVYWLDGEKLRSVGVSRLAYVETA
ncbi:MAG: exodeoxyribonuclease V subunit alpha, partial [Rhodoferax sp.]